MCQWLNSYGKSKLKYFKELQTDEDDSNVAKISPAQQAVQILWASRLTKKTIERRLASWR